MSYRLTDYVPPTIDLNTQVKRHCRVPVDYTADDIILQDFLTGAIAQVELDSERIIGYATCIYTGNPEREDCDGLSLFRFPVIPLVSAPEDITVEYYNASDAWASASVTVRVIEGEPAMIGFDASALVLNESKTLPQFRITAKVGYNPDDDADDYRPLPGNAIPAVLQWCAESYAFREVEFYARANASFHRSYSSKIESLRWRTYP